MALKPPETLTDEVPYKVEIGPVVGGEGGRGLPGSTSRGSAEDDHHRLKLVKDQGHWL